MASTFSLERFRSEVLSGAGLSRPNRFEVSITPPRGLANSQFSNLVSLYVEQTSMPLLNIFTKPLKIFGPSYQRPITSEYGGDGISFNFHVDKKFDVRKFFEEWMHLIVDPETFTVGYQESYVSTINIRQLDDQNNAIHEVQLLEAFPRNMNLMDLNNASSNQTHRINILFAYRYWIDINKTRKNEVPQLLNVITPQVPREDVRTPRPNRQWNWPTGELEENTQGSDLPPSA